MDFLSLIRRRQLPNQSEVDLNFLGYFEDKYAWILETPFDVGNSEVRLGREIQSLDMDLRWNRKLMWRAVKSECSSDLNRGIA